MRARATWLLACLAACTSNAGPEELKLGKRSRDAGPPVVIIDRPGKTGGPVVVEKEPNELPGGQPLPVPGSVRGRIDKAGDVDAYKITLPAAGTLKVTLSGIEDADLILEVQQPGGELVASSDNGGAKVDEGFPNLFVQPGNLVLVVREFVKPPPKKKTKEKAVVRSAPSQEYLLTATLLAQPGPGEEHELNDQSAFADEIGLGQTGRGYIGWRRDTDVWRVPLEGVRDEEALSIDVDGVENVALKVVVQDATGAVVLERKGKTGGPVSLRSVAVRDKSPVYFVVVSGDRPNDVEPYTIRVAPAALVVDEETEPNDTVAAANALSDVPGAASGARVGTLPAGDVDFYRLDKADGARHLSVSVAPPASIDAELAVVGADGAPLAPAADAGKKGAEEKIVDLAIAPGAEAYVRVTAKGGGAGETERYRLKWSLTAD